MKNAAIFVAKRTKNWHGKHVSPKSRSNVSFPFFSLRLIFFFNRHATETATETQNSKHKVKKKNTQLSREDHISSKVGFLKFCYLLFLANNYETVILNIETFFYKTVLLPLLVELEFELETKSTFGAKRQRTTFEIWSSI